MLNVFPHRFYTHDNGFVVDQPMLSRMVWTRIRTEVAPKLTWYATDVEVLNTESIRLFVYDMRDNFRGGVGDRIFEIVVTDFTAKEKEILARLVQSIYTEYAEEEFEKRESKRRSEEIMAIRKELFGV